MPPKTANPTDTATPDVANMTPQELAQYKKDNPDVATPLPVLTENKPKEGSLKISISLDLDVEVHLTARVKGDIVIGLL